MSEIDKFLTEAAELVNSELDWLIPATGRGPQSLRDAMRWSLFAGGKRLRPSLVLAIGRNFGAEDTHLLRAASAIEMIHTYSLIHDDLPSMDDDDLRRGRQTCHVKYGESTAILAGDALQALAFQTIAESRKLEADLKIELISGLGKAAASMVVGQQLDLEAERRQITHQELEAIHRNKTGALIEFAMDAAGMIARCSNDDQSLLNQFGEKIGLLFQIVDDLLDVTATTETLGKTAGKDASSGKATYPSVIGLAPSKKLANDVADQAIEILDRMSAASQLIRSIPSYLLERSY